MDLTTFYYPTKLTGLRLVSYIIQSSSSDTSNTSSEEENQIEQGHWGFIGVNYDDYPYAEFIQGIQWEARLEPEPDLHNQTSLDPIETGFLKTKAPMYIRRIEDLPIEIKAEVIVNCCFKRVSIFRQAMIFKLSENQVKNIIYEFKALRKTMSKINNSLNNKHEKLDSRHHQWLSEFVETRKLRGFTRSEARAYLLAKFPDLGSISISTVGHVLRQDLGLTYKKLGGTNIKKVKPESRANLTDCVKVLINFLLKQYYIVFLDEFTINRNTLRTYGWTQKGKPGRMLVRAPGFKMSFIVAHSQARVEGIMGMKSTFDQTKYKTFLRELVPKLRSGKGIDWSKVVIVADNSIIHRTSMIRSLFAKEKLLWLFIPPYSPEINAWEKLINFIKSKVKKMVIEQR